MDADGRPISFVPSGDAAPGDPAADTAPTVLAPPRPVPLELAPPRPGEAPKPVALALAPPRPSAPNGPLPIPKPVPLELAPPRPSRPDPIAIAPAPSDISRSSFAPPPPVDPRMLVTSKVGPPRILLIALVTLTTLNVLGMASAPENRSGLQLARIGAQLVFAMALLLGRSWARSWSLVVTGLSIVASLLLMALPLPAPVRVVLGLGVLLSAFWLYVLFRPDVVAYCKT